MLTLVLHVLLLIYDSKVSFWNNSLKTPLFFFKLLSFVTKTFFKQIDGQNVWSQKTMDGNYGNEASSELTLDLTIIRSETNVSFVVRSMKLKATLIISTHNTFDTPLILVDPMSEHWQLCCRTCWPFGHITESKIAANTFWSLYWFPLLFTEGWLTMTSFTHLLKFELYYIIVFSLSNFLVVKAWFYNSNI